MSPIVTRSLVAAALAGAAFATAGTASATPTCVGTQNQGVICNDRRVVYSDCVYVGSPPCTPVSVSGPVCIYGGGPNWYLHPILCS
jgi:hypothetical protein